MQATGTVALQSAGVTGGKTRFASGGVAFEELAGEIVALPRELPASRQWQAERLPYKIESDSGYSHSMVLGGLLEMSKHTRLTPLTSLMMRVESRAIKS